jgi:hypothetical protein
MHHVRTPQVVNVGPAQAARKANALQRRVWEAEDLLESLGYTVQPPESTPEPLAACTISR